MSDSSEAKEGHSCETNESSRKDNSSKKKIKRKKKPKSKYCTICCKKFATSSSCYQHMRKYHIKENESKIKNVKFERNSKRLKKEDYLILLQKSIENIISSVKLPPRKLVVDIDRYISDLKNASNEASTSTQVLINDKTLENVSSPPNIKIETDNYIFGVSNATNEDSSIPQVLYDEALHTFDYNTDNSITQIRCEKCHFMFSSESNYNEHIMLSCNFQQKDNGTKNKTNDEHINILKTFCLKQDEFDC